MRFNLGGAKVTDKLAGVENRESLIIESKVILAAEFAAVADVHGADGGEDKLVVSYSHGYTSIHKALA